MAFISVLDQTAVDIDQVAKSNYDKLIKLIEAGVGPRGALNQIYLSFASGYLPEISEVLSKAFTAILEKPFTVNQVYNYPVGNIPLSAKLYQDAKEVSRQVEVVISEHAKGIQNLRDLALKLYEGYDFNSTEVLVGEQTLPKYLKSIFGELSTEVDREVAKLSARGLQTAPLRASYLKLIDSVEKGVAKKSLDKAISTAIHERLRFYADRVAQTELARSYAKAQALKIRDREDVQYVQVRYAGNHSADICNMFGDVDRFGLGNGVYPKDKAVVPPYHPGCRCRLISLVNLVTDSIPDADKNAERVYLQSLTDEEAAGVLPKGTRDYIAKGGNLRDYLNAKAKEEYAIPTIGDL